MKNYLSHFYLGRFKLNLPEEYRIEFEKKILFNNLIKFEFIARFAILFFFLFMILNYLRIKSGYYEKEPILYGIILGHLSFGLFFFPLIEIARNKEIILDQTYSLEKGKQLFSKIVGLLIVTFMYIALFGLWERNSSVTYPILIILINLVMILHPKVLFWIDFILFLIIIIAGFFLMKVDVARFFVHSIESLGFTVPVFIAALFYYKQQVQSFLYEKELEEKNKIIEESLRIEFEKQIAEIKMSALRAQMNPHFLFNALNSIKLYVVNNDSETAATYLSKFAKLIRQILNNSTSKRVSLKAELQVLDLYIQMEQFRFNFKFDYKIIIEENIDRDFIEIPPMIIQPYVENAIWHGLMHKDTGKGELLIKINLANEKLIIVIDDNGIGRKKSMQIKTNKSTATKHQSVGMKITENRLTLANKLFGTYAEVRVDDKRDENGGVVGTSVMLTLPFFE